MNWVKSSLSAANGCCVEVAHDRGDVLVRHSRFPAGHVHRFTCPWVSARGDERTGRDVPEDPTGTGLTSRIEMEDYLSPDAMRWTPEEDQRAEARPRRRR